LSKKLSSFEKGAATIDALHNDGELKNTDLVLVLEFALIDEILEANPSLIESFAYRG